jgi:beta-lactamase class A
MEVGTLTVKLVRRNQTRSAAVALFAVVLAGCGGPSPTAAPSQTGSASAGATASSLPSVSAGPSVGASSIASTPAGTRLAWVLDQVNGAASGLTAAVVGQTFAPSFLAQVPAAQLIPTLQQVAAAGPYAMSDYSPGSDGLTAKALLTATAVGLEVDIAVEAAPPNLVSGLVFKNASVDSSNATWVDIDTSLAGLTSEHSLLAAEVTGGSCQPIHALDAGRTLAVGSSFKLYVLGELAAQIESGKASWGEQLALRDDWKSLLGGGMQGEAAGVEHSLDYYARQMISVSDNTAADHLIHRLGREQVEANLTVMGMAGPSRDVPFLYTRDAFVLKATKDAALRQQYLAADAAGRRKLLDGAVAATQLTAADFADWTSPRDIDTIEWFASTNDLCAAMSKLHDLSGQPGLSPILDILAINPGIAVDAATWPYVGYKGGSEPGVLQLTWLLRRADGRWFVLSMTLDDPASAADETFKAVGLANTALGLLAKVP